jgi:hypothetical protein
MTDLDLREVAEPGTRPRDRLAGLGEHPQDGAPGERPEHDDDAGGVDDVELAGEERCARIPLFDRRLVEWRRAANCRRNARADEREPIVRPAARGPVGETGPMEGRPQEVAAGVAGEDATRPVAAVRRRGKPDDEDPRVRIAEARQRPAPVRLVAVAADLLAGDRLAPGDEPGASSARDDLGLERGQLAPPCGRVRARGDYFRRSLSRRRDTTIRPAIPMTARYATWTSSCGPMIPSASDRMRSTPWYSGVSWTTSRRPSG